MSALPFNRPNARGFNIGNELSGALSQLGSQLDAKRKQDDFLKLYSANPQFAQGLVQTQNTQARSDALQAQEQDRLRQQQALREFSSQIGGFNPDEQGGLDNALARYAEITGDPTQLLNYKMKQQQANSPASMGATGALAQQLIDEPDNGIDSFAQALQAIKGGSGAIGRLQAEAELARKANREGRLGTLEADLELQPDITEATAGAKVRGEAMEKGKQNLIVQQRSLESMQRRNEFIENKANDVYAKMSGMTTGWTGSIAKALPGSEAYDLKEQIKTLVADSGINSLLQAKKEGATFGALQEKELDLLISMKGSLEQSQSKEQLVKNLDEFLAQRKVVMDVMNRQYEQDYGRYGGAEDEYLPAPASQTSPASQELTYNPATGGFD